MFPDLFEHNKRKNRTTAEAMVNEAWICDLIHAITPDTLAEYVMLWIVVDVAGFDPSDQMPHEIIWTRTTTGEYSARPAYQI
jgi:hypothetical protein